MRVFRIRKGLYGYGWNALHLAVIYEEEHIVSLLLEKGANVNKLGFGNKSALYLSAVSSRIIALLLNHSSVREGSINGQDLHGKTPLMYAVERVNVIAVQLLLERNANVNIRDLNRRTALYFAVKKQSLICVNILLERGADVNVVTSYNESIVHLAVRGCLKIVQLLLQHGASTNIMNNVGDIPLHYAVKKSLMISMELVKCNAGLNSRGQSGATPLHVAAAKGKASIVEYLLREGADMANIDYYGHTPLFYALCGGFEIVSMIMCEFQHNAYNVLSVWDCGSINNLQDRNNDERFNVLILQVALRNIEVYGKQRSHLLIADLESTVLRRNRYFQIVYQQMFRELLTAKITRVEDSCLNYFHVLAKDARSVRSLSIELFMRALNNASFVISHPTIQPFVVKKIKKLLRRRTAIENYLDRCSVSKRFLTVPYNCAMAICTHLLETEIQSKTKEFRETTEKLELS